MIPSGWSSKSLQEIALDNISYGVVQPGSKDKDGVYLIRGGDFPNGKINVESLRTISKEISQQFKRTVLKGGELLISLVGYPGAVTLVPEALAGANIARQAALVRLSDENSKDYVYQYLASSIGRKKLLEKVLGSAQQVINLKDLKEVPIVLPPKGEQEKIAQILSTWDVAIERYAAILNKKELRYQISLNDIFGKSKTNESWTNSSLERVSSKITDGAHSSPPSSDGGHPMLSVKDMREFGFDLSQPRLIAEKHYRELINLGCKPEVGDVLIAKDGSVLKYIFEVREPIEAVLLSSIAIIRPNPEQIIPSFLAHSFRRDNFKEFVRRELTSGSGVPRIVLRDFKKIKINVPELLTQRKIVALLDATILDIALTRRVIDLLKIQKQGLIQQLLAGKKRAKV